jgi:hypothetical protein
MAYTLDVDFDVYKAVFARRSSESVTENDVLRELLGLPPRQPAPHAQLDKANGSSSSEDWVAKGVRFPVGTEFRVTYKGRTYTGRVQGGALVVDGKPHNSPSAAAVSITKSPVNGWRFWECRLPGKPSWQPLETLRN